LCLFPTRNIVIVHINFTFLTATYGTFQRRDIAYLCWKCR